MSRPKQLKYGMFIDPGLQSGVAVVDVETKEVLLLDMINLKSYSYQDVVGLRDLLTAFTQYVQKIIDKYDIDFLAMEYINCKFGSNGLNVLRLNIMYLISLTQIVNKRGTTMANYIYLIKNPVIRSHLLKYYRTLTPEGKRIDLNKAKIRDLTCNYFGLDGKDKIISNDHLTDALAVALTYLAIPIEILNTKHKMID